MYIVNQFIPKLFQKSLSFQGLRNSAKELRKCEFSCFLLVLDQKIRSGTRILGVLFADFREILYLKPRGIFRLNREKFQSEPLSCLEYLQAAQDLMA